ncbi:hypothetical protein [Nostoc sp. 2RC]|uniref:hypothetical protein n=1 Tax=Nostoc sp. 2RC TaxID=2485484 RepID=UPI001628DD35|nr:hypothetical protein [Nostoc sp. 2RC]MBC1240039.1 hypothetical protein [Nostoc sp. 2RC]
MSNTRLQNQLSAECDRCTIPYFSMCSFNGKSQQKVSNIFPSITPRSAAQLPM